MIIFFHPRSTKPRSRRFPLSILSIAALLEGKEDYVIVDGNVDREPLQTLSSLIRNHTVELLAVSVMPGPQMVAAMEACHFVHQHFPKIPIVWGGYFPSLYPEAALNAPYVDFVVRGQGEETFLELLAALRFGAGFQEVRGLSFKDTDGAHVHNRERPMKSPDTFPWLPYHRLDAEKYILADVSRKTHSGSSSQCRLPVPVHLLRRSLRLWKSREDGVTRPDGSNLAPSPKILWNRFHSVLR